jgi:hypothetical protein
MKKKYVFIIVFFISFFTINSYGKEKLGLLIIAHGAPQKEWNRKNLRNIVLKKSMPFQSL